MGIGLPRIEDVESLPFPVAHPLAGARDSALVPTERLSNALFAAYQVMRTAGLLMLSDYLECQASDAKLDEAIRGLRMPHWYEWSRLCQNLCDFWDHRLHGRPERVSHFPSIVSGWRAVGISADSADWAPLLAGLPGLSSPKARHANDALWKARNDRAHRQGTLTVDRTREEALLERLLPIVEAMCAAVFPPGRVTLLRRVAAAPLRVVRIHGPHLDLNFESEPFDESWADLFDRTQFAAIGHGGAVSVFPLFAPDDEGPAGRPTEIVTLVDGVRPRKVSLLGVQSHFESEHHLAPLTLALGRKRVDFTVEREQADLWTLAEWSRATARETVDRLRGHKYFPESYVERAGVDALVDGWLEDGGRALLLLGEAGSGKSSLLTRLVDRSCGAEHEPTGRPRSETHGPLARDGGGGDVVLFLSGRHAYRGDSSWSGDRLLCEAVAAQAGIRQGTFCHLNDFCEHLDRCAPQDSSPARRVWMVFDAINEADRFVDVLRALDDFLPAAARYPWLRTVVSCRTGAYLAIEQRHKDLLQHSGPFANEASLARFISPVEKAARPYLEIRPFDVDREGPEAYRRRIEAFPERSCRVPYASLPPETRRLLLNPLHLQLFHETFAGHEQVGTELDDASLAGAYLDRLCAELPGLSETLSRIGRLMVEQAVPVLPADQADEWVDDWRRRVGYRSQDRVAKLDPIEELAAATILMRPAEEGFGVDRRLVAFSFSHQRLCEQVILRELRRQILPRTAFEPGDLARFCAYAEEHAAFLEYSGALSALVASAAVRGEGALVASLLEIPQDFVRERLVEDAVKALGMAWGSTEDGRPLPRRTLQTIDEKASRSPTASRKWRLGSRVNYWLAEHGATWAAIAVVASRIGDDEDGTDPAILETLRYNWASRGDYWLKLGHRAKARACQLRALEHATRLFDIVPESPEAARHLALALGRVADIELEEGRVEMARAHGSRSLSIARALVGKEPGRVEWRVNLSETLCSVAFVEQQAGNPEQARRHLEESLEIDRSLGETDIPRASGSLEGEFHRAVTLSRLGHLALRSFDNPREALPYFEESAVIRRRLAAASPGQTDFMTGIMVIEINLGDAYAALERSDEARSHFESGLSVARRLHRLEPDRFDLARGLHTLHEHLGDLALKQGRPVEACEHYEASLAVRLGMKSVENRASREFLAFVHNLAELERANGRVDQARICLEQNVEGRRRLMEEEPDRDIVALNLSVALHDLGVLERTSGRTEAAKAIFSECLQIRRRLYIESANGYVADHLVEALKSLAEVESGSTALRLVEERVSVLEHLLDSSSDPSLGEALASARREIVRLSKERGPSAESG